MFIGHNSSRSQVKLLIISQTERHPLPLIYCTTTVAGILFICLMLKEEARTTIKHYISRVLRDKANPQEAMVIIYKLTILFLNLDLWS